MKLGRYEIIGTLGEGGNAKVLVARAQDGTKVVLKVPLRGHHDQLERVRDEARVGLRLHHPAIVDTLDLFEHNGRPILVVDFIDGASLAQVRRTGALTPAAAARIGRQIAEALTTIHEATSESGAPLGMLHRDVTPANILISQSGDAKLIDLGIARSTETQAQATEAGAVRGTLRYLAPELLEGQKHGQATDIWALGVVLWEAVLGRRALIGDDREILSKILRAEVMTYRPGEALDPRLHDALAALIAKPQMRLQKAKAVVNVFSRLQNAFGDGQSDLAAAAARAQKMVPKAHRPLGERTKKLLLAKAGAPSADTVVSEGPRPVTMPPRPIVEQAMPKPIPAPKQRAAAALDLDAPLDESAATIQMPAMDFRDLYGNKGAQAGTSSDAKAVRPVTAEDINVKNVQARYAPTEQAMPAVHLPDPVPRAPSNPAPDRTAADLSTSAQPAATVQVPTVTDPNFPPSNVAPVTWDGPEEKAKAAKQAHAAEQARLEAEAERIARAAAQVQADAAALAEKKAAAEKAEQDRAAAEARRVAAEAEAAKAEQARRVAETKRAAAEAEAERLATATAEAERRVAEKAVQQATVRASAVKAESAAAAANQKRADVDVKSTQMLHGGMLQKEIAKARAEDLAKRAATGPAFAAIDPERAAARQPTPKAAKATADRSIAPTQVKKPLAAPPVQPGMRSDELAPTAAADAAFIAQAKTLMSEPDAAPATPPNAAAATALKTAEGAPVGGDPSERQVETERVVRKASGGHRVLGIDDVDRKSKKNAKQSKKSARASRKNAKAKAKNSGPTSAAPSADAAAQAATAPGAAGFGQMSVTQQFYATDIEEALQAGDLGQEVFDEQFNSKRPMVIAVGAVLILAVLVGIGIGLAMWLSDDDGAESPAGDSAADEVADSPDDKKAEDKKAEDAAAAAKKAADDKAAAEKAEAKKAAAKKKSSKSKKKRRRRR